MPLSTSSFERTLPSKPWLRIITVALLISILFGVGLEYQLAAKGFKATALDTPELWLEQRARASELGKKALILIGGSRIQLGVDLAVLRSVLPLEPVQLAVDGSSSLAVLKGLAEDETIRGTVMIDYYDHLILLGLIDDKATELQRAYEVSTRHPAGWAVNSDRSLERMVRQHLRSYADGARPITSFLQRAMSRDEVQQQYLLTFPDRSREADYQKVPMPSFYHARALSHAGLSLPSSGFATTEALHQYLRDKISTIEPADNEQLQQNMQLMGEWIKAIRSRGGDVVFVRMPVSGFVKMVDDARYPREDFFDWVGQVAGVKMFHFEDDPATANLICPDGSHLDYRDKRAFTQALAMRIKANLSGE